MKKKKEVITPAIEPFRVFQCEDCGKVIKRHSNSQRLCKECALVSKQRSNNYCMAKIRDKERDHRCEICGKRIIGIGLRYCQSRKCQEKLDEQRKKKAHKRYLKNKEKIIKNAIAYHKKHPEKHRQSAKESARRKVGYYENNLFSDSKL